MADPLYELLAPHFDRPSTSSDSRPPLLDSTTSHYLARLTTLSIDSLETSEEASLTQASQSVLRSLQALSKRSHRSVIAATRHLSSLSDLIPSLNIQSTELDNALPALETSARTFAQKYDRSTDNAVLDRRKRAMLLHRNIERVGDILDLPTLLSTAVGSSSNAAGGTATSTSASGYASALDLHAHVRRLRSLYPESDLVGDIATQADDEIQNLITLLITGLQSPALKLAGAMRTIGWLRRVTPDLAAGRRRVLANGHGAGVGLLSQGSGEGTLGALFLVCRLTTLQRTLEALEPLKDLADQETLRRGSVKPPQGEQRQERWTGGAQTERYLKRYIEIFREQSFAIISMYKSIFPSALPMPGSSANDNAASSLTAMSPLSPASTSMFGRLTGSEQAQAADDTEDIPSALATFAPHLTDMLFDSLRAYMPNISERASRDSLLTQVLYCAGSLGRLGADFGMMLAIMEDEMEENREQNDITSDQIQDPEWVQVTKKHRVQAGRLELLASGVGSGRKASAPAEVRSSVPVSPA